MELRHLRYFLAVADEGHFGRAAEKLHIVQPALSAQIRSLEEELGVTLFVRSTRKVELSDAGRILLIEARRMVEQAERAKSVMRRAARGETGVVRIGFVGNAVAAGRLSDDLLAFHAAWPDVAVELHEMAPAAQLEALLAGRLDVGYCPQLGHSLPAGLQARPAGSWHWEVAMGEQHPLAARRILRAVDLREQPFIVYAADGDDEGQLPMLRRLLGGEPRIAYKVGSTMSVLALAAAGLGLALVPAPVRKMAAPNLVYRRLAERSPLVSELAAISRAGGEWGAAQRYLDMLNG
ncbi:LysR family transcriptional regulator [Chromobacterium vaccinii]|uniref:LysR substrate-binding domain-containing protein n=1 Tax=Chromobacterium vaccinii TaxID=1108595 RepID=UPI0006182221|nr:LysR substrate-binding domain-containing protein [Chromobacterium vaccinii]QND83217.1 LysR family transcriptional regulator [Chromobacterium vaccinii]QND88448.1 LysR family transcriptional regulator [Chromobacterium vaccinii]